MLPRVRAYCRVCDAAVDAEGDWPGACMACGAPIEEHPVPDVISSGVRILLVGINPGTQTARARVHFANPKNAFWTALRESGLAPEASPDAMHRLAERGLGITNVVTRATPGSGDVAREDVAHGRARLEALVRGHAPEWLAFVGKEAYRMAAGHVAPALGEQSTLLWGARVFVLPSTSPANAAVPWQEKVAWFRRLAQAVAA